jgi:hypothetical protein
LFLTFIHADKIIVFDHLFLKAYMKEFLKKRNRVIKEFAESEKWEEVFPAEEYWRVPPLHPVQTTGPYQTFYIGNAGFLLSAFSTSSLTLYKPDFFYRKGVQGIQKVGGDLLNLGQMPSGEHCVRRENCLSPSLQYR